KVNNEADNKKYLKSKELQKLVETLNNISTKLNEVNTKMEEYDIALRDFEVVAPCKGRLLQNKELKPGDVINVGDVLGYMERENSSRLIESYIPDTDITGIELDMPVKIKLNALKERNIDFIEGKVSFIASLPVNDEKRGKLWRIEITTDHDLSDLDIGNEGSVNILTGTRTVFDYFAEPFTDGLKDSLKEK
nr:HlyD family secretion protein [Lachnospiraceae bacterium]